MSSRLLHVHATRPSTQTGLRPNSLARSGQQSAHCVTRHSTGSPDWSIMSSSLCQQQLAHRRAVAHSRLAASSSRAETTCPQHFVDLANNLADAAADITRQYFRSPISVESKADQSPVTVADKKAEAAMRKLISAAFPDHGIYGEEAGMHLGSSGSGYLWVLDPIDGTRSFITGKPLFGTLISLLEAGKPILGIIDQPITGERWLGAHGRPTTLNGKEIGVRTCEDLREAYLYATSPHMFMGDAAVAFNRVRDEVLQPMYGCDCYAYGLLAAGFCDLVVEADLKPYDYMALVAVVEGAGGVITDWQGRELRWPVTASKAYALQDLSGEVLAAGDRRTHQQALKLLDWAGGGAYEQASETFDIGFQTS